LKRQLVFATHNQNKWKEIQALLPLNIRLLSLTDIGCDNPIPEYGKTVEDNAWIKADFVKQNYGMDCFADDTGLEVEALGNTPGVFSARYAGEAASATENMDKLLANLKGQQNRKACFRTVIAMYFANQKKTFEGVVSGEILTEKQGDFGFAYDPIFRADGMLQSFASLTLEQKNQISHRKRAFSQMVYFLNTLT